MDEEGPKVKEVEGCHWFAGPFFVKSGIDMEVKDTILKDFKGSKHRIIEREDEPGVIYLYREGYKPDSEE